MVEGLNIIYEDKYLFALNKPACMHSVGLTGRGNSPSVAELILKSNPSAKKISKNPLDGGLANRLDFETSGVLIAAKNKIVWNALNDLFKKNKIYKSYYAILEGKAPVSVKIENYLGSEYRRSKKVKNYKTSLSAKGRALKAVSKFKLIKYMRIEDISLVEIQIVTGRRHQIRAHAKYIGHPLVGDRLYGSKIDLPAALVNKNKAKPAFLLHCHQYKFSHPMMDKELKITAKSENF